MASPEDSGKSFKPGSSSNSAGVLGNHLNNEILKLEYTIAMVTTDLEFVKKFT